MRALAFDSGFVLATACLVAVCIEAVVHLKGNR